MCLLRRCSHAAAANHKAIDRIPIKTSRPALAGPRRNQIAQYPHEVVSF
jgi:predicted amidohydrolase YtcJ